MKKQKRNRNRQPNLVREEKKRYRVKMLDFVRELKNSPCTDCGSKFPHYVMEFDHKGNKINTIGSLTGKAGKPKLLEEIAKCDLVCANCHKARTYFRRISK